MRWGFIATASCFMVIAQAWLPSSFKSCYCRPAATVRRTHHPDGWTDTFLERFQGDFDNYNQVKTDRKCGMLPREGGGHEHMHCTLIPLTKLSRLACFYFDGLEQSIFRLRYYHLIPVFHTNNNNNDSSSNSPTAMEMFLYTLSPELDARLRQSHPLTWGEVVQEVVGSTDFESLLASQAISLLKDCEVRWSNNDDNFFEYETYPNGTHAVMVHGSAIVESINWSKTRLLIKDQLSLYENCFYIHDRGYNADNTNEMVYGNYRNVPYILDRVSHMDGTRRIVFEPDLAWTMGDDYRTPELYQAKLQATGGGGPLSVRTMNNS